MVCEEYKNYISNMRSVLQSADLNPNKHLWEISVQRIRADLYFCAWA